MELYMDASIHPEYKYHNRFLCYIWRVLLIQMSKFKLLLWKLRTKIPDFLAKIWLFRVGPKYKIFLLAFYVVRTINVRMYF